MDSAAGTSGSKRNHNQLVVKPTKWPSATEWMTKYPPALRTLPTTSLRHSAVSKQAIVARTQARVSEPPPLEAMNWALKMTPAAGAMWVMDWKSCPARPIAPAASFGRSSVTALVLIAMSAIQGGPPTDYKH